MNHLERIVPLHNLSDGARRALIRESKEALSESQKLVIDLSDVSGYFPNGLVPLAALVEQLRSMGTSVTLRGLSSIAERMNLRNPIEANESNIADEREPLSRMWVYFDHEQANSLTKAFIGCIRRKVECQAGVLEALEWCLFEVLDNVMQHSKAEAGFAMIQIHRQSGRLAVCVADTGIGVHRSLGSSSVHKPTSAFDALTLAIKEGVTRNERTNQGNGLFGLTQIVSKNQGSLRLISGRGVLHLTPTSVSGDNKQPVIGIDNHGTIVDLQVDVNKPVSLGQALNYTPTDNFLESLESDHGEHVISIRDQAGGAGSRQAARELKILIMNVLNNVPSVVLDFDGQAVVSSSFADEVIGKMFAQMGYTAFNQRLALKNMNATVAGLVDRAIAKRLQQGLA